MSIQDHNSDELIECNWYDQMAPYVGCNYGKTAKPKLLLIGESHYLESMNDKNPNPTTYHQSADFWYSSKIHSFQKREIDWISTAEIIDKDFRFIPTRRAYSIWKNALQTCNTNGPDYPNYLSMLDEIAFMNFFIRPAETQGGSLHIEQVDVEQANARLEIVLKNLSPSAVVFLSKKAFNNRRVQIEVPFTGVPHPASAWWNKPSKRYGGRTGKEELAEFIKSLSSRI